MTAVVLGTHRVRVVVAGTAGGVGTTTVAAIVWDAMRTAPLGAPLLYDHGAGDVGARLPNGDEAPRLDEAVAVHDLGRHASGPGLAVLGEPHHLLVAVTDAAPPGVAAGRALLTAAREQRGVAGLRRVLLVVTGAQGIAPRPADLESLRAGFERNQVLSLSRDRSLAPGGRVPLGRLSRRTAREAYALGRRTADLVARHRG